MHGGFKVLMVSGCLIATGWSPTPGKLQVRAIPDSP